MKLKIFLALSCLFSAVGVNAQVVNPPHGPIAVPTIGPIHQQHPIFVNEQRLSLLATKTQSTNFTINNRVVKLTYDVVNNLAVFEGDIILGQADSINTNIFSDNKSASTKKLALRWPGGIVPYVIKSDLANKQRVTDAIKHWEDNTDLKFIPRTKQKNYIEFFKDSGCYSSVGMTGDGKQQISLDDGCSTGNAIHEIGHAVGLWHEQTRADRDENVTVKWSNIQSGKEHNFKTYVERGWDGQDQGDYDFGSIMHYGSYFFSKNSQATIVKKDGSEIVAQRTALSNGDLNAIENLYKPFLKTDCIGFNPNTAQVKSVSGKWLIVDGNHYIFNFDGKKSEADKALQIIKTYNMSQTCYVGRPNASLIYLLTNSNAPQGTLVANEDCIGFNRADLDVVKKNNKYLIVDGNSSLLNFEDKIKEAYTAYRLILDEGFTKQCFVGRPNPSFTYWKK